jgi:hypothetical protein
MNQEARKSGKDVSIVRSAAISVPRSGDLQSPFKLFGGLETAAA